MKDVKAWIEKSKTSLDSPQNKKRPLRDQHALREKMLADITIQKTKISMSVEKLQVCEGRRSVGFCNRRVFVVFQVHFRSGIGGDSGVTQAAEELIHELDDMDKMVREQTRSLESCLAQVEQYQGEVQQLRQQVAMVEQQLRNVMAPTYSPHDREKAQLDQQVGEHF